MPDQNLPPVDMSTFKPLGSTEPTAAPEAGNSLPPVDMSTFKPLGGVPDTKTPPQAGMVDRFAQGFGSAAASTLTGLGKIASVVPGIPQVANAVGDVMGLPKLDSTTNPYDTVAQGIKPAQQQAQSTIAGKAGGMLENIAEFMTGEEGLKGLSEIERMRKLMPVMKMFEESPRLLKAAQVAMTAAQTGMVMGGQELAHGGTAKQAAEQAGVGAGLGVAGSAIFSAGKFGYNALKAAGWSGAALDAVTKIASENVRPAEEVTDSLSHQITNAEAVMHTSFDNAMESIRGKVGDVKVPLSGSPLHEAAVNLQTDMAKLPQGIQTGIKGLVPAEGNMSGLIEGLTDGKTTALTGSQLIDLRQQLSKQLTRVSPAIKEGIGKILDGIDDTLDHVAGEAGHVEGVSDEYSSARAAYRQTLADLKEPFIQRIQNGKISDALDMLGKGQEAPHRMDVLKRLIGQDSVAGLGLNKFADVIKAATDEDGRLSIQKAVAGWEKLSDQTRKSMFEATPEVGARLEQLMDGLRTMGKVQTYAKVGAGLTAMGLSAAALSSGFKGTVSAIETVGAVAMLAGFGKFGGGQELIEKLATNKTLLEGLGKMYGYTGENVVQRLGQVGTQTAEQLAKQGAEGPAPATAWDAVMNAAKNISTGSEEGAVGNVRKRVAGEPGTSSLIGKRGVAAAKTAANQADDVAAVLSKKGAKGAVAEEPKPPVGTPGHEYLYEQTNDAHQVTVRNPEGKSVAIVRAVEEDGNPNLRTVRFSSGEKGEGLKAYGRMAEATKAEANRTGNTITLQGDAPDDMSAAARRTWVKLSEQHGYDVQRSADNRPYITFRPEASPDAAAEPTPPITAPEIKPTTPVDDLMKTAETKTEGQAILPAEKVGGQRISQRKPTGMKAPEDALNGNLIIGMDAIKKADAAKPGFAAKLATTVANYPGFQITPEEAAADPMGTLTKFVDHIADNLEWLHNQIPENIRGISKLWYDSAHELTKRFAKEYGVTHEQMAGAVAALSPQNEWNNNIEVAKRVADTLKTKRNFAWSPEMETTAARIGAKSENLSKILAEIRGKTLGQLDDTYDKAAWIRVYDESHNGRTMPNYAPDGSIRGVARNPVSNSPTQSHWNSTDGIAKAVSILEDGSKENIHTNLGDMHKIRNFYNNIIDPWSKSGDVTIDTHAVGAGHLRPMGGSTEEVLHNFGGAAKDANHGVNGTYGLYAEAYRQAAAKLGILPRELQSITWEGIRALYESRAKTPELKSAISQVWKDYKNGAIDLNDARSSIVKAAGGFKNPKWLADVGQNAEAGPAVK